MTQLEDWIGKTETASDSLDLRQVNLLQATLREDAREWREGQALPHGWHWAFFTTALPASKLGRDGHPQRGGFMPPVPLPRRMWAGGRLEFHQDLMIGKKVEKRSTIQSVAEKAGRSGPLCFITVRHEFFSDAELCLNEEHDLVYREDPSPDAPKPQPPEPANQPDFSKTISPDVVQLFRYSAVTFNGHRIHYDLDYAQNVEGYPHLVFHAPLTANLLMDLAKEAAGSQNLASFRYRAVSPLFANADFSIHGRRSDTGFELWATNPEGRLAMQAEAEFST